MRVIVRYEIKLGSGCMVSVIKRNEDMDEKEQLENLINKEVEWLSSDGTRVDTEINDDDGGVHSGDYTIWFYVCDVKEA